MREHQQAFARLDPDLLQFNLSMSSSCQWAQLVAVLARRPAMAVENSAMGTWSTGSARLKRFTARRLCGHVAVGRSTARAIELDAGLEPGTIGTLYHGVPDVKHHAPGTRPGGRRILNIARHDPVKGIDVLLEALARLGPDTTLVQIGSRPRPMTSNGSFPRWGSKTASSSAPFHGDSGPQI